MQIFAASYVLPVASAPIAGGAIAIEMGRITAVGPIEEVRAACPGHSVTDFPGSALVPGLVNAHCHLELTHFNSWKVRRDLDYLPKTFVEWISQVVKIRRTLTKEELEQSVRDGIRHTLESGTTAVGEILTNYALAPIYGASGLQGRLFLEAVGHDPFLCSSLVEKIEQQLQSPIGGLLPGISPHTPFTVSEQLFRKANELCRSRQVRKAVHLSESPEEVAFMFDTTGGIAQTLYPMAHWDDYLPPPRKTTSTAYLDSLGVWDGATLAIHAVHLTPADAAILKARGVSVVLCPRSNEKLAVGTAPHHLLKSVGIPLALGTDSLASNDSLSLWDEMRFLRELSPDQFSAVELIEMATLGGARALGIESEAGSFEIGKRGDFQVVSLHDVSAGDSLCTSLIEHGRVEEVYLAGELFQSE